MDKNIAIEQLNYNAKSITIGGAMLLFYYPLTTLVHLPVATIVCTIYIVSWL